MLPSLQSDFAKLTNSVSQVPHSKSRRNQSGTHREQLFGRQSAFLQPAQYLSLFFKQHVLICHVLQRWAAVSNTLWTHQSCSGVVWIHKTTLTPHTGTSFCLFSPSSAMIISSNSSHTHRTMQHTILYTLHVQDKSCIHNCVPITIMTASRPRTLIMLSQLQHASNM